MVYKNDYLESKYSTKATSLNRKRVMHGPATSQTKVETPHYLVRKLIAGISILLILLLFIFWQSISDSATVLFSSSSDVVKQAGRDAGLNLHGQALFLSNNPEYVSANVLASACPHSSETVEFGCYIADSHKIYILQVDDKAMQPIELTAIAHETLHAAWNGMSNTEQQTLNTQLTSFYKSGVSSTLSEDAKPYESTDQANFVNELHSLSGSEVDVSTMPIELQNHFGEYFSNQNNSTQAKRDFDQNIAAQIADLTNRSTQLDSDKSALENFKSAHLDSIEAAMQQNIYYGDYSTYNLNVDTYNHNRDIYNGMIDTYNAKVDEYNNTRQNFITAFSSLFPNKTIPVGSAK